MTFDSTALTSRGGLDIYIAKFAADGRALWIRTYGSLGRERSLDVGVDGAGNIILLAELGRTRGGPVAYPATDAVGAVDFGGGSLQGNGARFKVTAKLDRSGRHIWSRKLGPSDTVLGVRLDGSFVLAGGFSAQLELDPRLTCSRAWCVYVVSLDPAGLIVWSATQEGASGCSAHELQVDDAISVSGRCWDKKDPKQQAFEMPSIDPAECFSSRTGLLPFERVIAEKNRALRSWSAYDKAFRDSAGGVLTTRQVQPDDLRAHFFAWPLHRDGKVAWVTDIGLNAKPQSIARGPSGPVIVVGNRGGRLEPTDVDPEPLKGEPGIFIATLAL